MSELNQALSLTDLMTTAFPTFLGCLIVHRVHPEAKTSEQRRYRGLDRHNLSADWVDADGRPPTGWLGEACGRLRQLQDPFEFVSDPAAALALQQSFASLRDDYEVVACALDRPVIENLLSRSVAELLGYEADEAERPRLAETVRRLRSWPAPPSWKHLGYDVAGFARDFYSIIFEELMAEGAVSREMRRFRGLLNQDGLFSTQEEATQFLEAYSDLPDREDYPLVTYHVLIPSSGAKRTGQADGVRLWGLGSERTGSGCGN